MEQQSSKRWVIDLQEADDGSGDLILPLPEDLLKGAGWKEGDTLKWTDLGDGTWSLTKVENDEQRIQSN